MELVKGVEAVDLCLWLPGSRTLAMSDLHLGYEGMMNTQGIFLPRVNYKAIAERLENRVFPLVGRSSRVVVNGDYKQEFGSISEQEWKEALDMMQLLSRHCDEIILVKGNHDTVLGPIARWRSVKLVPSFLSSEDGVLFMHGDAEPGEKEFGKARTIVIGHEHPCVTIRDGVKRETYKCFLVGKYKGKSLVVMPSMNQVSTGKDMAVGEVLGPFFGKADNFEVYAVEDKVYRMGKLKDL